MVQCNKRTTPTASNMMHSSPAVVDNVVYIGNENGHLYALHANNGTQYWTYDTGGLI